MSAASGFLDGLASGWQRSDEMRDRRRQLDAMDAIVDERKRRSLPNPDAAGDGGSASGAPATDPVATDLPPHARAFLNAVSAGESGGRYNVRYTPDGGKEFELTDEHPRIYEEGPHGPSSAAGRYMFTASTWDDVGGGAFTRDNQDRMAWKLAQDRYKGVTGGDLDAVLQSDGLSTDVMSALTPTWTALGNKRDEWSGVYDDSYARYTSAPPEAESQKASLPPRRSMVPLAEKWGWLKEVRGGLLNGG